MRSFKAIRLAAGLTVAGLLPLTTSCADKALLEAPAGQLPSHVTVRMTAQTSQVGSAAGVWLGVVAGYLDASGIRLLAYSFTPARTGDIPVAFDVNLAPCVDASAVLGKQGCQLYLGAGLVTDTLAILRATKDPLASAIDAKFPLGPFEIQPGRSAVIPTVTLSLKGRAP